ncbi:Metallothionein-like protein [Rhynchospora pubera]|uniref:Metallothionein-like protein n=1 Tax=Rhynchospora pubera TaxID=906938 RepID=A0AAV8GH72_9POAL|nr:Metallothionein-like protein [Rhynchospora pubera]
MSCCGGKCTCCTSGCSCGNGCGGCNAYSSDEGAAKSQTMIYTAVPLKGQFEGFEMETMSEYGAPSCKCGFCGSCRPRGWN